MAAGPIGNCWAADSWTDTCWEQGTWQILLDFVLDLNTRIMVYLRAYYGPDTGDLTTLTARYLADLTGDQNQRLQQLIQDATDTML